MRVILRSLLCILVVSSCGATKKTTLQEEYQNAARSLGMRPVYPPREDLQVGDVLMISVPKTVDGSLKSLLEIDPVDVVSVQVGQIEDAAGVANNFLNTRMLLDELHSGAIELRRDRVATSLPIVAFPEISTDLGNSMNLGIVRGLNALGLAQGARTSVTLSFGDVHSMRIPVADAALKGLAVAAKLTGDEKKLFNHFLTGELAGLKHQIGSQSGISKPSLELDNANRCTKYFVITEVYLAKTINYTYSNARILAAILKGVSNGGDANTIDLSNVAADPQPIISHTSANSAGDPPVTDENIVDAASTAKKVLESAANNDGLSFSGWDGTGVKFSKNYKRPVVIAWDGISASNESCTLDTASGG